MKIGINCTTANIASIFHKRASFPQATHRFIYHMHSRSPWVSSGFHHIDYGLTADAQRVSAKRSTSAHFVTYTRSSRKSTLLSNALSTMPSKADAIAFSTRVGSLSQTLWYMDQRCLATFLHKMTTSKIHLSCHDNAPSPHHQIPLCGSSLTSSSQRTPLLNLADDTDTSKSPIHDSYDHGQTYTSKSAIGRAIKNRKSELIPLEEVQVKEGCVIKCYV